MPRTETARTRTRFEQERSIRGYDTGSLTPRIPRGTFRPSSGKFKHDILTTRQRYGATIIILGGDRVREYSKKKKKKKINARKRRRERGKQSTRAIPFSGAILPSDICVWRVDSMPKIKFGCEREHWKVAEFRE